MRVRKGIKKFLTDNGASTQAAIVADCIATLTVKPRRVIRVIEQMTGEGEIIKTGDNYDVV